MLETQEADLAEPLGLGPGGSDLRALKKYRRVRILVGGTKVQICGALERLLEAGLVERVGQFGATREHERQPDRRSTPDTASMFTGPIFRLDFSFDPFLIHRGGAHARQGPGRRAKEVPRGSF
jgi:hypothetical protein